MESKCETLNVCSDYVLVKRKWHTCCATMPNQCKQIFLCVRPMDAQTHTPYLVPQLIYCPMRLVLFDAREFVCASLFVSRLLLAACVCVCAPAIFRSCLPILGSEDNYNWMRLIAVARPKTKTGENSKNCTCITRFKRPQTVSIDRSCLDEKKTHERNASF